jgi:hypothetical protein
MAADNIKYFNKIKIIALVIFLIYAIVYSSKFRYYLPLHSNYSDYIDYNEKKSIIFRKGIALVGGSNVRMGLSAEIIGDNFNNCYNFGISSEGIKFSEYLNFIGDRISPEILVYSTKFIWYDSPLDKTYSYNYLDFIPSHAITSQITDFIFPGKSNLESSNLLFFNSFGDQVGYDCDNRILSYNVNQKIFTRNNSLIIEEVVRRVKKLKILCKTEKVFVRIPPVYVNQERIKLVSEIINYRIKALKESGIILVGKTIVSSDKTLFCDNFHPNEKGRKYFSMELKSSLEKINY